MNKNAFISITIKIIAQYEILEKYLANNNQKAEMLFISDYFDCISNNIQRLLFSQKGCLFLIKMITIKHANFISFLVQFILNDFVLYATGEFSSVVITSLYSLNNTFINNQFNSVLIDTIGRIRFNKNAEKVIKSAIGIKNQNLIQQTTTSLY